MLRRRTVLVGLAALPAAARAAPLALVAAQAHYADLALQLAPGATVTAVPIGPAQDPHTFEPSPSIGRALANAQIVIQNGIGYDPWFDRIVRPRPNQQHLIVATILSRRAGDNSHLWYDPTGFERVTRALATALAAAPDAVLDRFAPVLNRIASLRATHAGTPIAATEPLYTLMTNAIGLEMRHTGFQLAIMNGTEPRISDAVALEADLRQRRVRLLVTNTQTAGGVALRAATIARQSNVGLAPIAETMPPTLDYQGWLMSGLDTLQAALEAK